MFDGWRRWPSLAVLLFLPTIGRADALDDQARWYRWSLDCGFASLEVLGSATRDDIDYGLVPFHFQHASLVVEGRRFGVRELRDLFPGNERVDPSRLYVIGSARCHAGNRISVSYSGGGNCSNFCELWVMFSLGQRRRLSASLLTLRQFEDEPALQRKDEGEGRVWMDPPFDHCSDSRCREAQPPFHPANTLMDFTRPAISSLDQLGD